MKSPNPESQDRVGAYDRLTRHERSLWITTIIIVVLAASRKFEVLARVELGEKTFATPAVANGVMYLRTQTRLYSLGKAP